MAMGPGGDAVVHLGVDFGTSSTVAVVRLPDGSVRSVLFDGAPSMPSAVFVAGDEFAVGADAQLAGLSRPAAVEPYPKQRIDDGQVLLGDREVCRSKRSSPPSCAAWPTRRGRSPAAKGPTRSR